MEDFSVSQAWEFLTRGTGNYAFWDIVSSAWLGWAIMIGVPIAMGLLSSIKYIGGIFKAIKMPVNLIAVIIGLLVAGSTMWDAAKGLFREHTKLIFELCETRGSLSMSFEIKYGTYKYQHPSLGLLDWPDMNQVTITWNLPKETADKLAIAREKLGITRVHCLAGWRGKVAIPFDLVWDGETWRISPYEAYEKAVERHEAPADFKNDWLFHQFGEFAYEAHEYKFMRDLLRPDLPPVEINPGLYQIDMWAPAPSLFGKADEDARLKGSPFDEEVQRHLYRPNNKPIKTNEAFIIKG